jgi:hypothetical protein
MSKNERIDAGRRDFITRDGPALFVGTAAALRGMVSEALAGSDAKTVVGSLISELESGSLRRDVRALGDRNLDSATACTFNNDWYQANKSELGLIWRYVAAKPEASLRPEIEGALKKIYEMPGALGKLMPKDRTGLDKAVGEQLDKGPNPSKCGWAFKMGYAIVSPEQVGVMQDATVMFMLGVAKHLQEDLTKEEAKQQAESLIAVLSKLIEKAKGK